MEMKKVVDDYDCMLNQTNIGANNNKFYVIQVIEHDGKHYSWYRWGRVGEKGASGLVGPCELEKATKDFCKTFAKKTGNRWIKRANFTPKSGKYALLEMGDDEDEVDTGPAQVTTKTHTVKETLPCSLDKPTQSLMKFIFDHDMFNEALMDMEIDVKKMPLGKISKAQIAKGFGALEKIEDAIKKNQPSMFVEYSSQFYTLIPHNFGRRRPPTIVNAEQLQQKMDMLAVLADIELAQAMQKQDTASADEKTGKDPHPLDYQYGLLQCDLKHVDSNSNIYQTVLTYLEATKGRQLKLLDMWEVDRKTEGERFAKNTDISNRKLLWHGTNAAVVAAILKTGLRIMPHSGGRVGRGIYFASEIGKSAAYVRPSRKIGIMFLSEVALGKERIIKKDDSSLTIAPKGFDSIIAKGRTEPDPKLDTTIILDGNMVVVPQGKPIAQPSYRDSNFSQSEYLVYREDQCRMRYLLKLQF